MVQAAADINDREGKWNKRAFGSHGRFTPMCLLYVVLDEVLEGEED